MVWSVFSTTQNPSINGFLTLLIMGVGYMIVPRFRNISLPFVKYAYLSFVLVLISLITQDKYIPYGEDQETYRFALYDLAIHTIAIGFIGITISLYLPDASANHRENSPIY